MEKKETKQKQFTYLTKFYIPPRLQRNKDLLTRDFKESKRTEIQLASKSRLIPFT